MGLLERIGLRERAGGEALAHENAQLGRSLGFLQERIAELELALEDTDWTRMGMESQQEFTRQGLRQITALSRIMFLKNPLVNRAVNLQAMYVWGQGVSIRAKHPDVDAVVQAFLDDEKNQVELTGHQARTMKEVDLQVEGNLFLVLFSHPLTGRTRVRTIPVDEVQEIICNPEDRKEPWYYRREWTPSATDMATGQVVGQSPKLAYYPDWRYLPQSRPATIGRHPVMWDSPVYHVRVGGLSNMRFGVPETYSGLDWARAYKEFLEDWATIVRAYSRFAFKLTTNSGKGIAKAKAKLGTTVGVGSMEHNPPPGAGSIFAAGEGNDLQPIRTAGATTSADDGRRMLLMVAAATGLPESFFGDVSVGTLATAKSLDRPTELKFRDRQTLHADVHIDLLQYVVDKVATAPRGRLRGTWELSDEMDERHVVLEVDPETGEPIDRHIDIDFPPILEHDKYQEMKAIIAAATLEGKTLAGTVDIKTVSRLLLTALGQDDIDELLDQIFPEGEDGATQKVAEEAFVESIRELREVLRGLGSAA